MLDVNVKFKIHLDVMKEYEDILVTANADDEKIRQYIETKLIPNIITYNYTIKDSYYDEREQKLLSEVFDIPKDEYERLVNMRR